MSKNFKKIEDLNFVVKIINEILLTLEEPDRTMSTFEDKAFAELLVGVGSGAITIGGSIVAISTLGSVAGLSAAGITSGLVAIGGTMLGGICAVAAAPIAIGGLAYYGTKKYKDNLTLSAALKDTYIKAENTREKLLLCINDNETKTKEREETLQNLLILINKSIENLSDDLKLNDII